MSSLSATGTLRRAAAAPGRRANKGLAAGRLMAFSAAAMPIAAATAPLNIYLPSILAQHFGMTLSTIGLIFLAEKIWGTLCDPLIGVLSDRTRSRFGRRRSWIAAGGVLFAAAGGLLFFPPLRLTPAWLAAALFAFYLAWSMIQIPFYAWSAEISGDYDQRTRIATYQTFAGSAALLVVLALPTLVDQVAPQDGRLKLAAIGGLLTAMAVVSVPLALAAFPEAPPRPQDGRPSLGEALGAVWGEPLLLRVLASDFAVTLGQSIRSALFVFFVSDYMGLPRWSSGLFLGQFVVGLAAGPIWMRIGYRLGKHRAAVAGELVQAAINFALLLVRPGSLPLLLALTAAQGLAQGSGNLMLRAIVADVADRDRLKSGKDRTALFFSVFSVSSKAAMAAAIGLALPLVGWLGFVPGGQANTPQALFGLLAVFALGPALFHLVSAVLVWGFPLDARAHAEVRRRLAERDAADFPPAAE